MEEETKISPPPMDLEGLATDAEFNAAWDEEPAKEPVVDDKKAETTENQTPADGKKGETTENQTSADGKKGEPEAGSEVATETVPENETAADRAERIARSKFGTKPVEKEGTKEALAPETKKDVVAIADFSDFDKDPNAYLKALVDKSPNKGKYSEILSEIPDVGMLAAEIARDLVSRVSGNVKASLPEEVTSRLQKAEALQQEFDKLRGLTENLSSYVSAAQYFRAVERKHPGAQDLAESEPFKEWLDKEASVGVRKLAESGDPEDGIAVLDVFKEVKAKKAAASVDAKKQPQKNVGLRASPAKPAVKRQAASGGGSKDDFDAGWSLAAPSRWANR